MKNLDLDIAGDTRPDSIACITRRRQKASDKYWRIDRTVECMAQNLERPQQAPKLANLAGASLPHFFSHFKQRMGYSPIDYFTSMRMRCACALPDSTAARIKEVAVAVGYEDAFYFSRVFKSHSAVAPTHYRRLDEKLHLEIKERLKSDDSNCIPQVVLRAITLPPGKRHAGIGITIFY